MAYFQRLDESTFTPTDHVSGAWNTAEQHIGPSIGLLAHLVEADRDSRRTDGLVLGRLSYDILGTAPLEPIATTVSVLRAGRTIELVEASLACRGRTYISLRGWLMQPQDTSAFEGIALSPIAGPDQMPPWEFQSVWRGGYVNSAEVRRDQVAPGRATCWSRAKEDLVEGQQVSRLASAASRLDMANGITVREDPSKIAFPNIDLTAHLFREPDGEWLGLDTSVSFGSTGLGITSTVIHDVGGPIGTMSQMLTLRPVG